ncbi:MAG: DNA alkylation repair protein [Elusimicrobia bacterium]|nr:DNA alkylation repair protein [Elusimicrobiota bacterium]
MNLEEILKKLKSLYNPANIEGMARFGSTPKNAYGIAIPVLRELAKEIGKNHELALQLWDTEIHEARILSSMIDDPEQVTELQMDTWVQDFDSWDTCDQVCDNLFQKTKFAHKKIDRWSKREEEFVKRSAFTLIACLAVHDKQANDHTFLDFLRIIKRESTDERNFVKKAVNWALRNIGKRNIKLNRLALKTVLEIQKIDSKSAKWIAADAFRELKSTAVLKRLKR